MNQIKLNPYLNFNGNTREAMEFYHKVLGGELSLTTFGEAGMPDPADYKDKIMHAQLESDGLTLMASEGKPGQPVTTGDNVSISLSGPAKGKLTEIFNHLAEGGKIVMPLATQSWGDTFGMVSDQFGIHWMVDITKE